MEEDESCLRALKICSECLIPAGTRACASGNKKAPSYKAEGCLMVTTEWSLL